MRYKALIIPFFFLCSASTLLSSCGKENPRTVSDVKSENKKDSVYNFQLTENQKKVLEGAKKCLADGFKYDNKMAYHVLEYKNGEFVGGKVFPMGDLNPSLGVCTDVTIRALRYGNVVDLQEAIYNDLKSSWSTYPMKRWGAKKPDTNIDHRRVPNQLVWFKKFWQELDYSENLDWQPGDVVVWDMDGDSWGDHIGIISDKFDKNKPYVIHNFPEPGYVAEEDVLHEWGIIGHFRVKD
jgi:uncharacterized protein YijF (DUF1287 family)